MALHHSHDHHHHEKPNFNRAFFIGIFLNLLFVGIEGFYGYLSDSLALIADAGHNLSDVLSLFLAWGAGYISTKKMGNRFSYGLKSTTIMAAFFNAAFLLVVIGGVLWESVQRILHPSPIQGNTVIVVAMIGIVVNGITAWLFASGRKSDINIRGAFLHMLGDALVSLGVVIAGFIYLKTQWLLTDPLVSIGICIFIVLSTLGLLKESIILSLQAVPSEINIEEVRKFLQEKPQVKKIHDLHIWAMSTTETALTCHLVIENLENFYSECGLQKIMHDLEENFNIQHSTIQLDSGNGDSCIVCD